MRFVLVNGRTPSLKAFCMSCCEPIHTHYLRECSTGLPFCDHDCYVRHTERWIEKVRQPNQAAVFEDYR
ncbi:hypothetical protein XH89_15270 [Bradyrhizobium sp. CCBAU 53340]|nr:hypothetical protein XH89_15270 [Bradyrhizobium sp. CCBAU 53340]